MLIEKSYRIESGEFGTKRLVQYGRCDGDQPTIQAIEGNCTHVYELVPFPNSAGAVLKVLDGTAGTIVTVEPPTLGRTYQCVKVSGRVTPLAPVQDGGYFSGKTVLEYEIVWQQVGAIP
jgi:hypothetical protein